MASQEAPGDGGSSPWQPLRYPGPAPNPPRGPEAASSLALILLLPDTAGCPSQPGGESRGLFSAATSRGEASVTRGARRRLVAAHPFFRASRLCTPLHTSRTSLLRPAALLCGLPPRPCFSASRRTSAQRLPCPLPRRLTPQLNPLPTPTPVRAYPLGAHPP